MLRYADEPQFLERLGLELPQAFHHIVREDCLLSDVTASAALGRQLAWQGLWAEGEGRDGLELGGKRVDKIWHAHKAMFDGVRLSLCMSVCVLGTQSVRQNIGLHATSWRTAPFILYWLWCQNVVTLPEMIAPMQAASEGFTLWLECREK